MTEVRVRFAPSPTGALHIGGVRTALYNYLFAKQHGGKCIFRLEDTDSSRFVPGAEEYIMEAFDWLGIHFDESVRDGGPYSPYKQSERKSIYQKYVHQLLEAKRAYIAFDTPEELTAKREEIKNFQYDASTRELMRNSLTLSQEEVEQAIAAGEKYVVRIKIEPGHDIVVNDLIRGKVTINSSVLDDKVLFKTSDMLPTYHMANVVDDHLMKISHVIRGEEWLPSAPLHVLLYRYLGWEDTMPRFAHLPLLLKPDGNGKLSKRDGDRLGFPVFPLQWTDPKTGAVSAGYREAGYFPEAVINFLALLGWNDGTEKEIFSMEELISLFNLEKCSKSGAKFDYEKGTWFNHKYLQLKSNEELGKVLETEAKAHGCTMEFSKIMAIAGLMKERCSFTNDLWPQCDFFFIDPTEFPQKDIKKRWKPGTHQIIVEAKELLENMDATLSPEQMEDIMKNFCETHEYGMGKVMNPLRLSLIGAMKGPQIFDFIQVIGMQKALQRIEFALKTLPQI